ncbi:MAG TPA: glucose-6-phosphate dehydrogenase [Candidatus Deferrimicrobiaceae bacterium]|jgi:glucose-6-phosphate 1-dehydrogenase|nr:glucose-6-phosphate dehydrogenase [Candidatus Deferrimicrobiaceae bacterium]
MTAQLAEKPTAATPRIGKQGDPCVMVIFGAAGDLTARMLIPALYNLARADLLSQEFAVLGVARAQMSDEDFRKRILEDVKQYCGDCVEDSLWESFSRRFYYFAGDFNDDKVFPKIKEHLAKIDLEHSTHQNVFYYLATAPSYFGPIVEKLAANALLDQNEGHWRRIIIEKPFGHDLESAKVLNQQILKVADEKQIYRIDHYLGKETVQNIMAFRFANGIFEPVWNRRYIDHVQISVAETVGVEGRGSYFDHAGSLRDMVPNHIMQLISLTTMEPPISFDANAVRDEQAKILHAIQPMSDEEVLTRGVRGQYGEGIIDGKRVPAYRAEKDVPPDSRTETYVAMKLLIDNWRWADVPFYLRTGKRMPARNTHIVIQFRRAPFVLFRDTSVEHLMPNQLVLHIQPEEGISLQFAAKVPGPVMRLGTVDMNFEYQQYFGKQPSTGYERLLHDCMIGDQTLFQRADMVEAGWSVVNPVLDLWKALPPRNFPNYAAGTWGPKEADELLERDGRRWRNFEK